ncbi:hypothetical protein EP331_04820 [bacterium]|nr:MAG: hypothetical protein EP331_04820 [bacterium]
MKANFLSFLLILGGVYFSACQPSKQALRTPVEFNRSSVLYLEMNDVIDSDSAFSALIKPYRDSLTVQMNETVGIASNDFTREKPESSLGNLVAESLREYASILMKTHVDLGLVNLGGLRTDLSKGNITVGELFEVMPFENRLIILELSGKEMKALFNEIAAIQGEPLSGARIRIVNNEARDIIINGQPLKDEQTYTVATSDYLANGGGNMPSLWKTSIRTETNYLIREIIIAYVKNRREVAPVIDGRVRS